MARSSPALEQNYRDLLIAAAVPPHLHEGLIAYLVYFIRPGDFLRAVLENNLREAVLRADDNSQAGLKALVWFLFRSAPRIAWGDPDTVAAWLAHGQKEPGEGVMNCVSEADE